MFARDGLPCNCWAEENRAVIENITDENAQNYETFWAIISDAYSEEEYAKMISDAKHAINYWESDCA
jgi:hypothetical protein